MSHRAMKYLSMLGLVVCMVAGARRIQAQDSSPTITGSSPPQSAASSNTTNDERLRAIEAEIQALKRAPKDFWDILSAVSGLFSGVVVALVGIRVTYSLNERNRISAEQQRERELAVQAESRVAAEQQKNRELAVQQAQTVLGFMPQLQSGGVAQQVALMSVFALDKDLGLRLANLYGTSESVAALQKIAASAEPAYAARAQQSLNNMITVSLKQFSPDLDDLRLSVSSLKTFYHLTSQVFWGLKGAVEAWKYEETWALRDKDKGTVFKKKRTDDGEIARIDDRSLDEVGIEPGMILEAIPILSSESA